MLCLPGMSAIRRLLNELREILFPVSLQIAISPP
jgi:hypothetical protein